MTISSNEQARGMIGQDAKVTGRQPAVQSALDHQEKMVRDLLEKVKILEDKMTLVLREANPQVQEENKDANEPCGLSVKINANSNGLLVVVLCIDSMIARLEI